MKLIFCRKPSLGSWLICAFTWSQWSHCIVVEDDEFVIDATLRHGGVRRRRLADVLAEYPKRDVVEIALTAEQEQKALDFVRAQIGKPYDVGAIFGFIARQDWASPERWFCNELAEAALREAGRPRFRDELNRITPRESWMVVT
jgi:uncharacterized protein YycO